jgi:hypothetical protein
MTDLQKRRAIDAKITQHYQKMSQDEKRITSYNYEQFSDLLSFCLEQFLTKKSLEYQYQVSCVDDALPNYMGRSMSLNLKSSTSPYWNQIRRQSYNYRGVYLTEDHKISYLNGDYDVIHDNEEIDDFECMMKQVDKLDFYHKPLLTDYYINGLNFTQMNTKYGISTRHLRRAIDEAIEIIRKACKEQNR